MANNVDELLNRSAERWVSDYSISTIKKDIRTLQKAFREKEKMHLEMERQNAELLKKTPHNEASFESITYADDSFEEIPIIMNGKIQSIETIHDSEEFRREVISEHESIYFELRFASANYEFLRLTEDEVAFKNTIAKGENKDGTLSKRSYKLGFKRIGDKVILNGTFQLNEKATKFITIQQELDMDACKKISKVFDESFIMTEIKIEDAEKKQHTISIRHIEGLVMFYIKLGMIPYPSPDMPIKNLGFKFQSILPMKFDHYFNRLLV